MNIVSRSKTIPSIWLLLLIWSFWFLASCSKRFKKASEGDNPQQFELTNCFATSDSSLRKTFFIKSSEIETLLEWWEIDSSSYFLLWNIQTNTQDTLSTPQWLATCIPENIAVCSAFRGHIEEEWRKGYSPSDVAYWTEFFYAWIGYKKVDNRTYSFTKGTPPINKDGSYNTEGGKFTLVDSISALNQEIIMFIEWFEEKWHRELSTEMIDEDEELQIILKKAWFERVINNMINYPPNSDPNDFPVDYMRRKNLTKDWEPARSFQMPTLKILGDLPWSTSAYNKALEKLNEADEKRREELLQRAKDMIDTHKKLIEEWCVYNIDIDLLSLQELEGLIPRLEAITLDKTQKEVEIETPIEDCFSITPSWQINSSCSNVSGNLIITNTSWTIVWLHDFFGSFDVWSILSSQSFPSWLYLIKIKATITDNDTGKTERRNQTLKYTKQ